jgi:hypothetical protein
MGIQKYLGRLTECGRSIRRPSSFWMGLYGQSWVFGRQFCQDIVDELMRITLHKLPFFRKRSGGYKEDEKPQIRKPCFFVQYVFNVTKSIRNCRLVSSPPAKFLGQPFGASSFLLLHSAAERPKVAVLSMVLPA